MATGPSPWEPILSQPAGASKGTGSTVGYVTWWFYRVFIGGLYGCYRLIFRAFSSILFGCFKVLMVL